MLVVTGVRVTNFEDIYSTVYHAMGKPGEPIAIAALCEFARISRSQGSTRAKDVQPIHHNLAARQSACCTLRSSLLGCSDSSLARRENWECAPPRPDDPSGREDHGVPRFLFGTAGVSWSFACYQPSPCRSCLEAAPIPSDPGQRG